MQTGAPLYNKDKIKKKKKKNALPTWRNLDGWTLNKQFFFIWPNPGLTRVPAFSLAPEHGVSMNSEKLSVRFPVLQALIDLFYSCSLFAQEVTLAAFRHTFGRFFF